MTSEKQDPKHSKAYWEMMTWGEPDSGPSDIYRWTGITSLSHEMIVRLRACMVINNWPSDVICRMNSAGPEEDGPLFPELIGEQIVSDRARSNIESLDPSGAQFLPVQLTFQGKPCGSQRYWVANWLRLVDAVDLARSAVLSRGTSKQQVFTPYILDERVPLDSLVFRLSEYQTRTIVRDTLRRALKKAKTTGFIFERCYGDK